MPITDEPPSPRRPAGAGRHAGRSRSRARRRPRAGRGPARDRARRRRSPWSGRGARCRRPAISEAESQRTTVLRKLSIMIPTPTVTDKAIISAAIATPVRLSAETTPRAAIAPSTPATGRDRRPEERDEQHGERGDRHRQPENQPEDAREAGDEASIRQREDRRAPRGSRSPRPRPRSARRGASDPRATSDRALPAATHPRPRARARARPGASHPFRARLPFPAPPARGAAR